MSDPIKLIKAATDIYDIYDRCKKIGKIGGEESVFLAKRNSLLLNV